ncbi:MAG: GHMP kinase [Myxococcota bacterium]
MTELFVSGRLCLFGEHSDWAGGYRASHPEIAPGHCLVAGTDQGLGATAKRTEGFLEIISELAEGERAGPERIGTDDRSLTAAASGAGFFSYAAATLAELRSRYQIDGLRLVVRSDLPVRKGLSSSAAICVLVARAVSRVYRLDLSVEEEMDIAYAGERRTGSECGRMDQICAFGRGPVAMQIDGSESRFDPVRCGGVFRLLIVDLRRGKDTRKILADLNACFPATPGAVAAGVRHALGERNQAIFTDARGHLAAGNSRGLGELMTTAQQVFDEFVAPACSELVAPRLHEVLADDAVGELGWGGKGVGSQGDGCAQIVTRGANERDILASELESRLGVRCLALTLGADQ